MLYRQPTAESEQTNTTRIMANAGKAILNQFIQLPLILHPVIMPYSDDYDHAIVPAPVTCITY